MLTSIVAGWLLELLLRLFGGLLRPATEDALQGLAARYRHKYPPRHGGPVHLAYDGDEARYAEEVFVAGDLNGWLQVKGPEIHPWTWQSKIYALKRRERPGGMLWEKDILIKPGHYDFKFVANRNHWIHWFEGSGYPRGNEAPGGPNFRLVVRPLEDDEQ